MQMIAAAHETQDVILAAMYDCKLQWIALDRSMTKSDISNYFSTVLQMDADNDIGPVRVYCGVFLCRQIFSCN